MSSSQQVTVPKGGRTNSGAQELAAMYSKPKRAQEIISIIVGVCAMFYSIYKILIYYPHSTITLPTILMYAFLGILTADFLSGMAHWGADSWGSVNMFIFGPAIIRSFREHHIDPTAITRHDFIETNGDSFLSIIPIVFFICYRLYGKEVANPSELNELGPIVFLWLTCLYVSVTNQIHKWAHTLPSNLPFWVKILQSSHVILSREDHHIHHVSPHARYFTITTGWLNYPFEKIGFWEVLEYLITKCTGALPRSDDMKWANKAH